MAAFDIPIPEHYAADIAYKRMVGLKGTLEKIQSGLVATPTAHMLDLYTELLVDVRRLLRDPLTAGILDVAPDWKTRAQDLSGYLGDVRQVMGPLRKKYRRLVSTELGILNDNGKDPTYEQVSDSVVIEQADLDAITSAITTALGQV